MLGKRGRPEQGGALKFCGPLVEHLRRRPGRLLVSQLRDTEPWGELLASASDLRVIHRRRSVSLAVEQQLPGVEMGLAAFPAQGDFDTAFVELPQGRALARAVVVKALEAVRPGGDLYVWGAVRAGIRPVEEDFAAVAQTTTVAAGGGERLFHARRSEGEIATPAEWGRPWEKRELDLEAAGERYRVVTQPGVFSADELDAGTRFFLEHLNGMGLRRPRTVLDACCGVGILGMAATRVLGAERVLYADDDVLAVDCARAGTQSEAVAADLTRELPDGKFDLVVCNPPFHQGVGEDRTFVRKFISLLPRGVELAMVANHFLPYERELSERFGEVEVTADDGRYRVYRCR